MRRIITVLCCGLLLAGCLSGCGGSGGAGEGNPFEGKALTDIMAEIYKGAGEMEVGLMDPMTLEGDMLGYNLGISDTSGVAEAVVSEPLMNVIPYSLCLVRVKADADVEALRQQIFDGADAGKWICVTAEKVTVNHAGDVIVLLMADADTTEQVYGAFAQLAGDALGERLTRSGV